MTILKQRLADIEQLREVWTMSAATPAHTAVMQGTRAGVTLSGTPGGTQAVTVGGITISGIKLPDNGQAALHSSIHTTGTFDGPVTGASAATAAGTKVYFVVADKTLTLAKVDDATTPYFGVVNYPEGYVVIGTVIPIKIGVVA